MHGPITQFKYLNRAVIDTSSLIYLSRLNLLKETISALHLVSVPGVKKEYGNEFEQLEYINISDEGGYAEGSVKTDIQIIETARIFQIPVISEDKKILKQAEMLGLYYYNSLMIMNFLIFKGKIDDIVYKMALTRLQAFAHYSPAVFKYGQTVYEQVQSEKNKKRNN